MKVVVRPERLRVTAGEPSGDNCIPAMIERIIYVGPTTQVHLRLPDGATMQAMVANHEGRPDWPAGTPVAVTIPPDALRVLAPVAGRPDDLTTSTDETKEPADG